MCLCVCVCLRMSFITIFDCQIKYATAKNPHDIPAGTFISFGSPRFVQKNEMKPLIHYVIPALVYRNRKRHQTTMKNYLESFEVRKSSSEKNFHQFSFAVSRKSSCKQLITSCKRGIVFAAVLVSVKLDYKYMVK